MIRVTNVCSKCQNEIEHGKENYLQLIDRNNTTFIAVDKCGGVDLPYNEVGILLVSKMF